MGTKRSTFALFFYINRKRQDKEKRCPVYLRISVNGTQTAVSIKRSILPKNWDEHGFPKGKSDESKDLTNYISILRNKLFTIQEELVSKENFITADMFRRALFGTETDKSVTLMEMFKERIEKEDTLFKLQKKTKGEYERFYYCSKYLKQYLKKTYNIEDISIRKVDRKFVDGFVGFMELRPSICHNYRMFLLQKFKSVLETAIRNELIGHNPFYGVSLALNKDGKRNYLTEDELQLLLTTELKYQPYAEERDIFCFSVFTGLANIDVQNLIRGELHKVEGQWWIRSYRHKTDVLSIIPLLPQAERIIRKYNPDFENLPNDAKLFSICEVNMRNLYLKKIGKLCNISKRLTTHVARHTFATTITLSHDVPLETVSKMLGHKSLEMTQHYAKILDKKIGRDMETLTSKISGAYQLPV